MTRAVLLDLGNVVLGIDFHRVFASWAADAGVDKSRFYDNWQLDDAYKAHEVGAISFEEYCDHLSELFATSLTTGQWRTGWNSLWTSPFTSVIQLLPAVKEQYSLYAFTNTNQTHAACWRSMYVDELATFEHIFVSSQIGARKPNPGSFAKVCTDMDCHPNDVIFLDDSKENVDGANEAGLDARHVAGEQAVFAVLQTLL